MTRFSDSNGKDRRRYNNGNGVQNGSGAYRRPLTSPLGWGAQRDITPAAQPKPHKRRVPDAMYTLRGYKAWAAKIKQSWEPES